jgi:catechol 2,3-dioxygenase-like lactoylglutathione lyase family enzyme
MPKFEAIGAVVADLERSAAFYRELGLEFPEPLDPEGHGHVEASLPGELRFMLDTEETVRSFDPDWSPPSGGGHRSALAFRCDSPAEVDATYARLLESGGTAHKEPWDAFWGQRYAEVKDPDGNVVDLFAPLEG